jgi:hypothetical protein
MKLSCSAVSGHSECKFVSESEQKEELVEELTRHISADHPEIMGDWSEAELAAMHDSMEENIIE